MVGQNDAIPSQITMRGQDPIEYTANTALGGSFVDSIMPMNDVYSSVTMAATRQATAAGPGGPLGCC